MKIMIITSCLHFKHIPNIITMQIVFITNTFLKSYKIYIYHVVDSLLSKNFSKLSIHMDADLDTHIFALLTGTI